MLYVFFDSFFFLSGPSGFENFILAISNFSGEAVDF